MLSDENLIAVNDFLIPSGLEKLNLKNYATSYQGNELDKKEAENLLEQGRKHLAELQDMLYADNRYSVLIILQAMDAAGKDGAVKHIMSGVNPQGVKVYSFKAPSSHELDHNYLWRHMQALPARGEIAIHNRSHYENVLVTRVHPHYILKENIPGIDSLEKIDDAFWQRRFKQIRRFEKNLVENGTLVFKFFLHLSKDEQKERFLERIDNSSKNWKFSLSDIQERQHWERYQEVYAEAIAQTSTEQAPWFVVPADNKWFTRLAIASIIYRQFKKLDLRYPQVSDAQRAELQKVRTQLLEE